MRILLFISLFVIWNIEVPVAPILHPDLGLPIFFSGFALVVLIVAVIGRRLVRRLGGAGPVARPVAYFYLLTAAQISVSIWFAVGVLLLGWRPVVVHFVGRSLQTPQTLVGLVPGLLAFAGLWWAAFPVERAVREMNVLYDVEAGLPVFPFPSLVQYLGNRFRGQMLFWTAPIVIFLILRDLVASAWTGRLRHHTLSDSAESAINTVVTLLTVFIAPALLRYVLQTRPLPPSPLRDRLSAVSKSAGVRCREILLWNTHFNTGNAAVMGLVRPVRYVILSDLLIESMTDLQIQSVFAHELGHVRHRHLIWLGAFLIGAGSGIFSTADWLAGTIHGTELVRAAWSFFFGAVGIAVIVTAFGFIVRWFERQADVYAARSVGPDGKADVEMGAHVFASALNRIAVVNNIPPSGRNFTHGSIDSRVRYVMKLATDPKEAERFDRRGSWMALMIAAAIVTGVTTAVALSQ